LPQVENLEKLLHPAPETWQILLVLGKKCKYCWDLVPRTGQYCWDLVPMAA
ncbi:hypothetical protein LTSEJOH_4776, partial [Salmonella enterica subsp. enterica serovar Johannesburg str. S5-703]